MLGGPGRSLGATALMSALLGLTLVQTTPPLGAQAHLLGPSVTITSAALLTCNLASHEKGFMLVNNTHTSVPLQATVQ